MMMREFTTCVAAIALITVGLSGCSDSSPVDETPNGAATAELTEDQRAALDAELAQAARDAGISDPPDVEIVRVVSQADWPQTRVSCLRTAGFDASLTPDGSGFSWESGPDQVAASELANYVCAAQYPVDPAQTGPLGDEQKERVYSYVSETLVPCLEAEGYQVSGLPTRQTFLAGFVSSPPWNPYNQIYSAVTSTGELDRLEAACPPNTPAEILWGQ